MKARSSYLALVVVGLVLLAGCARLPTTAPAASEGAPTAVAAAAPPAFATAAVAAEAAPAATDGVLPTTTPPATREPVTAPSATPEPTAALQATAALEPAFVCRPGALTPAQTEGPYYKANPPEAASLLQPDMSGTKLIVCRTSHIHVKVTAPGGPTLTTQLYFPEESANASDGIYNSRMLLAVQPSETGLMGRYDFVINTE